MNNDRFLTVVEFKVDNSSLIKVTLQKSFLINNNQFLIATKYKVNNFFIIKVTL